MFPFPDPTAPPPSRPPTSPTVPIQRRSPEWALAELVAGNKRFVEGSSRHGHQLAAAVAAATSPRPYAAIVGCMDSRVPVEAVFDQDFGAVCAIRTAGHALDGVAVASVTMAVEVLGVALVLVLGHTRCAAIAATLAPESSGRRRNAVTETIARNIGAIGIEGIGAATGRHVVATVRTLRGSVGSAVAGAVYDVDTGRVEVLSTV
ncbi:carbonic anhydrase 2 [Phytohabitans aurantiacus]|uniref:carbonic anhydrase n=1 Tax=Phytohabitans aurantiacus TaxID=3016789 RepID=A0ABQ5R507_9ACTN|nr:carbonic anhydrase 2 [Phytohabitans aurantiacus]